MGNLFALGKIMPFWNLFSLAGGLLLLIFLGLSNKKSAKVTGILISVASIFLSFYFNIKNFAEFGIFSDFNFDFGILQVLQICLVLFFASNILLFISVEKFTDINFVKLLIILIFSIISFILLIISRNFILIFISFGIFNLSIFQLVSILNAQDCSNRKDIISYFFNSLFSLLLIFFSFSFLYGLTDIKNLKQFEQSDYVTNSMAAISIIIIFASLYFFLKLVPFQGSYLKLIKRNGQISAGMTWFWHLLAGIFLMLKFLNIFLLSSSFENRVLMLAIIILALSNMLTGSICSLGTKSTRRILGFLFISYISLFLINFTLHLEELISRLQLEWLNLWLILVMAASLIPIYWLSVNIEKSRGSDHIGNFKGLVKGNTFFAISFMIALLSWLSSVFYLFPFINYFRSGNFKDNSIEVFILFSGIVIFLLSLIVNISRFALQLLRGIKTPSVEKGETDGPYRFPKYLYLYFTFFMVILICAGLYGLFNLMGADFWIFGIEINQLNIFGF